VSFGDLDFPLLEREPPDPVGGRRDAEGRATLRIPRREVRVPARLARHRAARRHGCTPICRRCFPLQVITLNFNDLFVFHKIHFSRYIPKML